MMVSCKRVHEWWNAKHFHISTFGQKSGAARSHPGSFKADEAQNAKIQQKTATGPKGLIPSDKVLLGFGHWPIYWGIQSPSSWLQTFRSIPPASMASKTRSAVSCKQDMNGYDGYGGKIIHLMDLWYFTATSPTWKNLSSIGGKSPYKTIISEHFCGTHTVASLDDLQGFIAEIPPKTMYVKPGPRHHQVVSKKPECFRRFHQPGKPG